MKLPSIWKGSRVANVRPWNMGMIHRTTKVSEAHSIDSVHALQRLFVLNAMMSRCADACLPGIEQCRATGYPVPQWPVQRRCHDDTPFQRNSHFDEFRRAP